MLFAKIYVGKEDVEKWDPVLKDGKADFEKEGVKPCSCLFLRSARLIDGNFADLKVVSGYDGEVWSEVSVHGISSSISSPRSRNLLGQRIVGEYYAIDVEICPFDRIGTSEDYFVCFVRRELENGISAEYSAPIAEAIAQDVADDVSECADKYKWNDCDVRLGIGRVILKALGREV